MGAVCVRLVSVRWGPKRPLSERPDQTGSQEVLEMGPQRRDLLRKGLTGRGDTSLYGQ